MKRPSFQMYAKDWLGNAKLRRCSRAARGTWIDVMCLMHDSAEYGVLRWPLAEIARAAGAPIALLKELASRDVLKGGDADAANYIYRSRHAGKLGPPITLLITGPKPCWYCSRFVRDEWLRQHRGANTRFGIKKDDDNQGNDDNKPRQGGAPKGTPSQRQGDGASTAVAYKEKGNKENGVGGTKKPPSRKRAIALPTDFGISPRVDEWAAGKGFDRLDEHLEAFLSKARAKGYVYVDWDEAFMGCIREDWARVRQPRSGGGSPANDRSPVWWSNDAAIIAKGESMTPPIVAKPGDSIHDLKGKIMARLDAETVSARASGKPGAAS